MFRGSMFNWRKNAPTFVYTKVQKEKYKLLSETNLIKS